MIHYPDLSPIAFQLGPLNVHWYGLMYLLGFLTAWGLAHYRVKSADLNWNEQEIEDLLFYGAMGVILGGRLGYMIFYSNGEWLSDPMRIFRVWEGGMSFHGGLIGVTLALFVFARRHNRSFLEVTDFTAPLVPLGLAFGRLGNFINGELWGRATTMPWAMIFPGSDGLPRHPSQIYAMTLEGLLLFIIVWVFARKPRPAGQVSGVFLMGYSLARMSTEFFRQPDPQWGFLAWNWLTMGQLLSIPLFIVGCYLWRRSCKSICLY